MIWNFRLCFSTPAISHSVIRDCCTKGGLSIASTALQHWASSRERAIGLKAVLIKENRKEHRFLSYPITSREMQLELTPDPGVPVKRPKVLIQTWDKGSSKLCCVSAQPPGQPAPLQPTSWANWGSVLSTYWASYKRQAVSPLPQAELEKNYIIGTF